MFNVLPDILKQEIIHEYRSRRFLIIVLFVLSLQIFALVLLFPSWITSLYREKKSAVALEAMNQSLLAKNVSSVGDLIQVTNKKLRVLTTTLEYPKIVPLLQSISDNKIPAIHINRISDSSENSAASEIILSGVAETRDDLVKFIKNLNTIQSIASVTSPIGNLAKNKNIDFTIQIILKSQ